MTVSTSEKYEARSELNKLDFKYLPHYAQYLLDNKIEEFAAKNLEFSREINVPILKYLSSLSENELNSLAISGAFDFLSHIADKKIKEYIDKSVKNWIDNRLPLIQNDEIVAEDIITINFVRRKVFRHFFPDYSSDMNLFIAVMEEVDRYIALQEEINYRVLIDIQQQKIKERNYLLDKITNTSPGIIHVFDLIEMKEVYTNTKRTEILGYTELQLKEMGSDLLNQLIHPEDLPGLIEYLIGFDIVKDGETKTTEVRVKTLNGDYIWLRLYQSVFKRTNDGTPSQIIGIALDITTEKLFSNQLYVREQELKEAQEIAEIGSFEWSLSGSKSIYSHQISKIFDLSNHSSLDEFYNYVHPTDRKKLKEALELAIETDGIYECEYRYVKDGVEKVIWSKGLVSFDKGKPIKMKGFAMDVTQRHHMLKRLERSEELHKQAQALTHIGNWSWSLIDNKISWSDELYRIYGLKPQSEEITYERFVSLIHPEDRENRLNEIKEAIETGVAKDYTMRIVNPDGTIKILEGKGDVLVDENNKVYKLIGTCQDVTQRIKLNEKLKENEESFRQLINNAPDAIIVIDQDSIIQLWNPKAEEIFGWTSEEIIGKPLTETIIPAKYSDLNLTGIERHKDAGKTKLLNTTLEITALNKQGKEFYIALSISMYSQGGKPVYISFIRDISKDKEAELELEEQRKQITKKNQELERSNKELTSFNYIASHDLQEPLRKIRTYGNRIIEKKTTPLPEDTKEYFERMITSAIHMQKLIDDLLAFSRTSSTEKVFEKTDINELLEEVKASLKLSLEEKGVIITSSKLPVTKIIPFQFNQLLENILSNSIKYSKAEVKNKIKITSEIVKGKSIRNEDAPEEKEYYKISIIDNGIGFEQQYANKIFEPFQRLHGKSEYSGTGIGLAICKKIMENHEGYINAESAPGKGSTFNIYLPLEINKSN